MTAQLRLTQHGRHAQHRHTMLPMEDIALGVDEDDVGFSLEHLPNSLLQGNFFELSRISFGQGVGFYNL